MKTRIVRFLIPSLLLAAIILGFIAVMKTTHWGTLKFSDEGCDPDQQGRHPYGPPREGILGFAWMTEDTLVVEAHINTHVEGARIVGDYRLEGNHLHLLYQDKVAGPATIMTCSHRVIYRISNLRQDNHLISIQPMDGHSTSLEFSSERCAVDIDPYGPPYEGIIRYTWQQDVLVVEAFVKKALCGGASVAANYRIEGDDLVLLYGMDGIQTDCSCAFKLVYQIANLEPREYVTSIHEMELQSAEGFP